MTSAALSRPPWSRKHNASIPTSSAGSRGARSRRSSPTGRSSTRTRICWSPPRRRSRGPRHRLSLHDNGDGTTSGHFTVPTTAAAFLRKILDSMTAPRRMREPSDPVVSRPTRCARSSTTAVGLEAPTRARVRPAPRAPAHRAPAHQDRRHRRRHHRPHRPHRCTQDRPPRHRRDHLRRRSPTARLRRRDPARRPRQPIRRPRPRPREPPVHRSPTDRRRTHPRHLRRRRLRTRLRLVRAPPPTTLVPRRTHRPTRRHPTVPLAPPTHPRPHLPPPELPDGSIRFHRRP